jgi:hypothetical protein
MIYIYHNTNITNITHSLPAVSKGHNQGNNPENQLHRCTVSPETTSPSVQKSKKNQNMDKTCQRSFDFFPYTYPDTMSRVHQPSRKLPPAQYSIVVRVHGRKSPKQHLGTHTQTHGSFFFATHAKHMNLHHHTSRSALANVATVRNTVHSNK